MDPADEEEEEEEEVLPWLLSATCFGPSRGHQFFFALQRNT